MFPGDYPGADADEIWIFCTKCKMALETRRGCPLFQDDEESKAFHLGKMCVRCWKGQSDSCKKSLEEPPPPLIEFYTSQSISWRCKTDALPEGAPHCLTGAGRGPWERSMTLKGIANQKGAFANRNT